VYDTVDDDCHDRRERGNALSAHPSTEHHSGNSMIFSAEVYKHCEGFSIRHVLLDTCGGEPVFKYRNLFYFIEPSRTPMTHDNQWRQP
jgi:hypothetical protein